MAEEIEELELKHNSFNANKKIKQMMHTYNRKH